MDTIIHPNGNRYSVTSVIGKKILLNFINNYKIGGSNNIDNEDYISLTQLQPAKRRRTTPRLPSTPTKIFPPRPPFESRRFESISSREEDDDDEDLYNKIDKLTYEVEDLRNELDDTVIQNRNLKNKLEYSNSHLKGLIGITNSYKEQFEESLKTNREYQDELSKCDEILGLETVIDQKKHNPITMLRQGRDLNIIRGFIKRNNPDDEYFNPPPSPE